uniref:DUF21 domain-containing protein n=1 Tax=candidate division WOR-3 bacterium TaxID=2052148 RepID=A0A7C3N6N4_UNCW3
MLYFFLFLLFSFCSFLMSGIETSFFSLSEFELHKISKRISFLKEISKEKKILLFFLISLNTFANVGIVIFSDNIFRIINLKDDLKILEIVLLLVYIVFFCEIVPKTLSIYKKTFFLKSFLFFLPIFRVFKIVLKIFLKEKNIKLKKIETDFDSIYNFLEDHKESIENEFLFLKSYNELKDRKIFEFSPQPEKIVGIKKGSLIKDAISLYRKKNFSRIPVFENGDPVGVLYVKDLLFKDERENIDVYIKDFEKVDHEKRLYEVLNFMINKNTHIVFIFKDKKFYSIVTLEDIINKILKGLKIINV